MATAVTTKIMSEVKRLLQKSRAQLDTAVTDEESVIETNSTNCNVKVKQEPATEEQTSSVAMETDSVLEENEQKNISLVQIKAPNSEVYFALIIYNRVVNEYPG